MRVEAPRRARLGAMARARRAPNVTATADVVSATAAPASASGTGHDERSAVVAAEHTPEPASLDQADRGDE